MKQKNVFILCAFVAVIFFALGGMIAYWFLGIGIGIGLWIGKLLFWGIVVLASFAILYWVFRKKEDTPSE